MPMIIKLRLNDEQIFAYFEKVINYWKKSDKEYAKYYIETYEELKRIVFIKRDIPPFPNELLLAEISDPINIFLYIQSQYDYFKHHNNEHYGKYHIDALLGAQNSLFDFYKNDDGNHLSNMTQLKNGVPILIEKVSYSDEGILFLEIHNKVNPLIKDYKKMEKGRTTDLIFSKGGLGSLTFTGCNIKNITEENDIFYITIIYEHVK